MRGLIVAGVCLLGMGGAMIANPAGLADLARGKGYDFLQTLGPRPAPGIPASERPLLVSFDSASQTPSWIDLSVLVRRLDAAGAKAVIVPEPLDRPDPMSPEQVAAAWMDAGLGLELRDSLVQLTPHRQILAEAFDGKKVIGVFDTAGLPAGAVSDAALTISVTNGLAERLPASPGARGNLAELERAMSGLGDAALRPEADNVVRTVPLATDVAGTPVASVLLRAVAAPAEGAEFTLDEQAVPDLPVKLPDLKQSLVFKSGKNGPVIPADATGRYRLYRTGAGGLPRVDAEAVLAGRIEPETIRGRVAVVGGVPLGAPEFQVGGGERWSRAEILTNALDQIAAGQHVERLSWAHAGEAVAMVLAGLVILLLAALPGTALMVLFTLTAIAGMWTGALYGLSEYGLWFDAALPTSGLLVTALLALMFRPAGRAHRETAEEGAAMERREPGTKERREPGLPLIVPALRRQQADGIRSAEGTILVCGIRDVERLEQAWAHSPETLQRIFKAFRNMASSHIESQGGTVLPEAAVGAAGRVTALWRSPK
ncbi:MAG: CHASE2 domain-containing protein, partial [Alphaproteobacteria bacterium]